MILPDGNFDVSAGKIATVVTHLEMTELPAIPSDPHGAWTNALALGASGAILVRPDQHVAWRVEHAVAEPAAALARALDVILARSPLAA